jgi:hypothetical protein
MIKFVSIFLIIISFSCNSVNNDSSSNSAKPKVVTKATTQLNFIGHWLYQAKREMLVREFCTEFEFQNQECTVNLKFPEDVYYSRTKANSEEEFVAQQLLSDKP